MHHDASASTWVGTAWVGAAWVGSAWVGSTWVGSAQLGPTWVGSAQLGPAWVGPAQLGPATGGLAGSAGRANAASRGHCKQARQRPLGPPAVCCSRVTCIQHVFCG